MSLHELLFEFGRIKHYFVESILIWGNNLHTIILKFKTETPKFKNDTQSNVNSCFFL